MYRSNPIFRLLPRDVLSSPGTRTALLTFLILASLLVGFAAEAAAQNAAAFSPRPDVSFAFSDFDGDRRPDLAVVQSGRSDLSLTDYWVQLQLSGEGSEAIRVVGPTGGLRIDARDVNGDQVPDLVLTTTWRNQPVAILLNDGHGNFSRVDPSAHPEAFNAATTSWTSPGSPDRELLVVPSQSRSGARPAPVRLELPDFTFCAARRSDQGFLLHGDLAAHSGRAPPSDPTLL